MLNLGTMTILISLYFIKVIVLMLFVKPFRKNKLVNKCFKKMSESLFFGEILILIIEAYLEICLAGTIMM